MRFENCPEPLSLIIKGRAEEKVVAFACGKCGRVARDEQGARECCADRVCDCGTEIDKHYFTACPICRAKHEAERDRERFESAEKILIKDYDGPLYDEISDQFFANLGEMLDYYEGEEEDAPHYAWSCDPMKLKLDAQNIIEGALDQGEFHDEAIEHVEDIEGLQALIDQWRGGDDVESWFQGNKVVLLEKAHV